MRVQVKQLDLNRGEPGEPVSCPVARAIRRALRNIGRYPAAVEVGSDSVDIYTGRDGNYEVIDLPKKASDLIQSVDSNSHGPHLWPEPAPLTFTMRRPA